MLRYKTETRPGLVACTTSGQETERVHSIPTPEPALGQSIWGHHDQLKAHWCVVESWPWVWSSKVEVANAENRWISVARCRYLSNEAWNCTQDRTSCRPSGYTSSCFTIISTETDTFSSVSLCSSARLWKYYSTDFHKIRQKRWHVCHGRTR